MNIFKEKLSPTELTIAEIVSKGFNNHDAAAMVFRTEKTVKFHLTNIYRKLGIKSRTQLAVLWASTHQPFPTQIPPLHKPQVTGA